MKRVVVGPVLHPKVNSWKENTTDVRRGCNAKIDNLKPILNKAEAKDDTKKKTQMLDGANKKVSGEVTCGMI
jgi:hypothetical protein